MFKKGTARFPTRIIGFVRSLCLIAGFLIITMAARPSTFTNFQILWPFAVTNGTTQPNAAVTEASDGMLYGITYGGATPSDYGGVFKIAKDGSQFQILQQFNQTNGENPAAPLIEATNGVLYGTTSGGATNNGGTIFQINKNGSGFAVVHYLTVATNDGGNPSSGLLQASDGRLYGTSQSGGTAPRGGDGVVFRMDLTGSNFTILHSFSGNDGDIPAAALIQGTNGLLFGATSDDASNHNGTIFQLDTNGNNFAVIHYFAGGTNDGSGPSAKLFKGPNGKLYGTTVSGGRYNNGGIAFSLDYNGSNYTVLHNFGTNGDGNSPQSDIVQGPDGALYGTTYYGGGNTASGTVFVMNADGSNYALVMSFFGTNGSYPNPLILGSDGAFYDTCNFGGPLGQGTVFKLGGILPDVLAPPINLGNGWRVSGHGAANLSYTLLFTTNISTPSSNWTVLGPLNTDSSGNWHYDDLTNTPQRFYQTSYP